MSGSAGAGSIMGAVTDPFDADGAGLVAIGVGNILLGDDGVGVRVIEALRDLAGAEPDALPPGTRLVDGGTLGGGLLDVLAGARAVLVVDAVDLGGLPGALGVWRDVVPASVAGTRGVGELLGMARLAGMLPPALTLVGVGVHEIRPDLRLSASVAAAVPRAVATARRELDRLAARVSSPRVTASPAGTSAARGLVGVTA
jgi:hydrogenase maturation protease